jgi:ABC-2 type transport system permease protein
VINPTILVARREITERVRDRSFIISTMVGVVLLAAFALVPRLLGFGEPEEWVLGVVGEDSAAMAGAVEAAAPNFGIVVTAEPLEAARVESALTDGDVDAVIVDGDQIVVDQELDPALQTAMQAASAQLEVTGALNEAGLNPDEVTEVLTPDPLDVRALDPQPGAAEGAGAIAFFAVFLLYGQIFGYGFAVASGVVEEKSTRVVEVILSTVSARQLLAGKVMGIGVVAMFQLLLTVGAALAAVLLTGFVELPEAAWPAIWSVLGWFLLGFTFYAALFAAAGSLVSRQEELQNVTTPLTMVVLVGFFLAFAALNDPSSTLARVASFIPPVAPMVMPARITLGEVAPWEVVASAAVCLASIAVLIPLAARLYRGAILRTGTRVRLFEAWRAAGTGEG